MTAVRHFTHDREIVVGAGRVIYSDGVWPYQAGWMLPGQVTTLDESRARACAEAIDRLTREQSFNADLTKRAGAASTAARFQASAAALSAAQQER